MEIFKFNTKSDITNWKTINDVVMGGNSNSLFTLNDAGYGVFSGKVSLENDGGFSMVQYHFDAKNVSTFSKVYIKVKGDGKNYQFRIKSKAADKHSYIASFNTTLNWSIIEIPFNSMYPAFRGKTLDLPNYPAEQMEQIAFLIGNKKEETFKLEIDSIILE
ncbi:complex I intermediate-associated protein 30 (CIA30) [Mariniflexile fucanivorans]|uniref:Complex I intermediate-associated protein 30 (CIA30) n=1 Tax=Mariniflexile fucanivorans TaxID=264023 RepID=A0A4R1RKC1_9FLAO|nr:CIA30 family protein [Mariniflexile fucanivorans]TCL66633.1 complex I intermediate-associated protein 30 (CIA30) [Mariniflexile fucanivorans]